MLISLHSPSLTASVTDSRSASLVTCVVDYDGCDDTRRPSPSTTTAAAWTRAYCVHLDGGIENA
jgi:hypothetical protein